MRREKGRALYYEGAVEVVEERLREPTNSYGTPKIAWGVYSVRGLRDDYAVTCEVPELGVPDVRCDCEDYRRRGTICKHGYAALERLRATNMRISLEGRIESAREALANGGGGLKPEFHRRSIEMATRELEELGPGEGRAEEAAAVVARREQGEKSARRREPKPPLVIDDDTELPL